MKYLSQLVRILLLTVGIFSYDSLFSQTTTFTSSDTYTIPAGVTQIKVEAWGGGGRGGSRTSGSDSYGGGGGGAYVSSIVNVTPLTNYTVTVGLGSNNNANPGGDSWFSPNNLTNAIVLAKGGNSVPNNSTIGANGGNYTDCIGDIRNNGGRGANASSNAGGGGGASAGSTGIGPNAINEFGAIAATDADGTGGNGQTGNGNGSAGTVPGGGGGGARRTSGSPTGGNGANGRIIITVLGPQSAATTVGDTQWVAPAGITAVEVEAWGAGGRGGQRSNNGRGGGGGGGAYSRGLVSVTPGQTYYINVGAGSTTTSAGQSSWFNSANNVPTSDDFVLAVGGNSAPNNDNNGATGGSLTNGYGNQEKRSGGNGANSTGSSTGGGGASAGQGANGGNATGGTRGIAPSGGGNGANGHNSNNTNGYAGVAPGGGGSGARRSSGTRSGGAGANGQVIIHTFYNLAIQKTVNTTTPLVGSNVTFTITVTNNGTNTARGISVLDQIPTGLTFVSAGTPTQGTFNSGNLTWTIGELAPAAVASIAITATVNATGNYTNRAVLSMNLANQSSSTSAITVFPQQPTANMQITKEVDNAMPLIGEEVIFTLTAYNAGPQNATGVVVQDVLPLGFTYVSNSGTYDANTGTWAIGTLNPGILTSLTITATINISDAYYNQATISGNQFDPDLNNNSSGIEVYPMYPMTEITLPCATINYDLSTFNIGTPPPGAEISWHTATPADDSNRVATPTNTQAGRTYYVAYYDPVQNCYGSTSVVKIIRSCLITNPMIRQRVR